MLETIEEIAALQSLLDASHATATGHLKEIVNRDRTLTAQDLVAVLTGMKVLSVATVTAHGEPRISALDGHFLHGTWTFGTGGAAAKAVHLRRRRAVSVAHIDGEELAVFSHGQAEQLRPGDDFWTETIDHWTAHYGTSPVSWGPDIRMYRLRPHWMVGYAADRAGLLARRARPRVQGSLRSAGGTGIVRLESRFGTGVEDLWPALTDPGRLAHWLGEFEGDLRLGGEYRSRFLASGAEATGRVLTCEPPRRFTVAAKGSHAPDEHVIEVTLTADGTGTVLVVEQRGLRLDRLAAFAAGLQIHVEDLAAHLAGGERGDAGARMAELIPAYEVMVVDGESA